MRLRMLTLLLTLLLAALTACEQGAIPPTPTPASGALPTAQATVTTPATDEALLPVPTETPPGGYPGAELPLPPTPPAGYPIDAPYEPYPGDTPAGAVGSRSAGLLLRDEEALRIVLADGQTQALLPLAGYPYQTPPLPSPSLAQLATIENGDIVIIDRATGERRNVTNSGDREECCLFGWLNEALLLIGSRTLAQVGNNLGAPALLALDGGGVTLLDEALLTSPPAISADGSQIAWGSPAGPRQHTLGGTTETLDIAAYADAPAVDPSQLRSPAFAPSGQTSAWYGPSPAGAETLALYILDSSARRVITVDGLGSAAVSNPTPASWYTSGDWLAFESYRRGEAQPEIVVYYPQRGETRQLGDGQRPTVSPGGNVLIYQLGTLLLEVDTVSWQAQRLPFGGTPLGWRLLPPE